MTAAYELARQWREDAEMLRRYEHERTAQILLRQAEQLEEALRQEDQRALTIRAAARESGYSEEHLRRLAREGKLPVERNGGPRSQIRIRRGDLPMKPGRDGRESPERVAYDPDEDARDIAKIMGGTS